MALLVAVLAAGRATRFGGGKLDADCAGKPLGQWALEAVEQAGLGGGVIVTAPAMPRFAHRENWTLAVNPRAGEGMATSVALAASMARGRKSALLLLLADMPLIGAQYLRELASEAGAACTRYPDGRLGVPARFPQDRLGPLEQLTGDRGAGGLLRRMEDVRVLAPPPDALLDVDSPGDVALAAQLLSSRRQL